MEVSLSQIISEEFDLTNNFLFYKESNLMLFDMILFMNDSIVILK